MPAQLLQLNDVARVEVSLDMSLAFAAYADSGTLGWFELVD